MPSLVETLNVFEPISFRYSGGSLGVKNVPASTCTYNCVYCPNSRTKMITLNRRSWYEMDTILESVAKKQAQARVLGRAIDHVTFIPDGEPTLDANLEQEIEILRAVGIKTSIVTNVSLIDRSDVQRMLKSVDQITVKVDTINQATWQRLNRPHEQLSLPAILEALRDFSSEYGGFLDTETMLLNELNDTEEEVRGLAEYLRELHPRTATILLPTSPPSGAWVRGPSAKRMALAYMAFEQCGLKWWVTV